MSKYVSIRQVGASEKAIEQTSSFLGGVPTWGDEGTNNIYAQMCEHSVAVVGVDRGDLGVRFFIPECNTAMVYHRGK
ncbi:MAG: hypothetical protein ACRC7S_16400 [Cetobacterium sp.]